MDAVLGWLDNPAVKYFLLLIGGFALKKWPAFVNKAIPLALLVTSILIAALHSLFPDLVPAANAAVTSAVRGGIPVLPWWKWFLMDVLMPVALAVGTQSSVKNTTQLAQGK
jgi:hypothetical protein